MSFFVWTSLMPVMPQLIVGLELPNANPNEPALVWKRSSTVSKGRYTSYLRARKLVSKGCIYHLVQVNDSSVKIPSF